ncbi:MAG TPA: 50S ribosomal protein L25/general stress protein Ctc [Hyphomicrobiales bacterium]|nr:50S ribosomal protein L25/general stress protein Ctc [Hyphomicrobiales bacterium]
MSEMVELKAEERTVTGSEAAKKLRKVNSIPGIIYGGSKKPQMISLERKDLWKQVESGHFLSTVYTLDVDGKKERVIPREIQLDPVRDFLIHVDFMRVSKTSRIDVEVPVRFVDEAQSPGLKRGGALNIVRHEVELSCPADSIPEEIQISLEGYDIGDSIHISSVKLPANVTPTIQDRDFTVATIAASSGMKSDEEGEKEAEEEVEGDAE